MNKRIISLLNPSGYFCYLLQIRAYKHTYPLLNPSPVPALQFDSGIILFTFIRFQFLCFWIGGLIINYQVLFNWWWISWVFLVSIAWSCYSLIYNLCQSNNYLLMFICNYLFTYLFWFWSLAWLWTNCAQSYVYVCIVTCRYCSIGLIVIYECKLLIRCVIYGFGLC